MDMTDIVVSTLSDFFEDNGINFKCLDRMIETDNPRGEVELIPSKSMSCETVNGKITICGDIENDYETILNHLYQIAESMMDKKEFCDIQYDIWRKKDRFINGNEILQYSIPELGIYSDDKFIYRIKHLPIQMIQLNRTLIPIDQVEMTHLGFGIDNLKVYNTRIFNGIVMCNGNHLNISNTGNLCMKESLTGEPLAGETLTPVLFQKIMTMASVLNLDDCLDCSIHMNQLEQFLNKENKYE